MYQIACEDPIIHTSASPVCGDASCPCHQGDPDCEFCHGRGCAECSDDIYYQQQEAYEQFRHDLAYDRSGATSPYGEQS